MLFSRLAILINIICLSFLCSMTRYKIFVQVFVKARTIRSVEEGLFESERELSKSDTESLERMRNSMTNANMLVFSRQRRSAGQSTACQYERESIYLGLGVYPDRLVNTTCLGPRAGMCGSVSIPGADVTSRCEPINYQVPVFRVNTSLHREPQRLQTRTCTIETYITEWIDVVVGCVCSGDV